MFKKAQPNEGELIFLCSRLKVDNSSQEKIKKFIKYDIDWEKLSSISQRQEIFPFIYYNLNRLNLSDNIPQNIWLEMREFYYTNLKKNLLIENEIIHICELSRKINLEIIFLKGFSLIQNVYTNPGLRFMVDVDILINNNEYPAIKEILTDLGYQDNPTINFLKKKQSQKFEQLFSKTIFSQLPLFIDIHTALVPNRPYPVDLIHLRDRAQRITEKSLTILSPEDTFISLVLHLRKHTRKLTLKFIVDIAELINSRKENFDWEYIKETAIKNHIMASVYSSLYLTQELLEANVSSKITVIFKPNIIKCALMRFTINRQNFLNLKKWQGVFLRFLLFDSLRDFFLYLWRVSFLERRFHKIIPAMAGEKTKK